MNGAPYDQQSQKSLSPRRIEYKSPAKAALLSCLPGLGQVYVGYYQQGFLHIGVVAAIITVLASEHLVGFEPFLGVFLSFFWIFNLIDASRRAHHYNRVAEGLGPEDVPEDFQLPRTNGSTFGGGGLVFVGVLFLLDLNFGVSMAWVENWWPMVLVVVGLNLIYRARRSANSE